MRRRNLSFLPVVLALAVAGAASSNPYLIWVPYVDSPSVVFDGQIEAAEWDGAGRFDVSDVFGLQDPPDAPGSVVLYASHDDSCIRIAVENKIDSVLSPGDVVFFWTDDNNNDTLQVSLEGHYELVHLPSSDSVIFFPHLGFPFHTDFSIGVGEGQGYVTFEAALVLGGLPHHLEIQTGDTAGVWISVRDGEGPNLQGVWPPIGGSQLVDSYGDLYLAQPSQIPAPSSPVNISVAVDRPDTVIIEWDNPMVDLAGQPLTAIDSVFIYENGLKIASVYTTEPGAHGVQTTVPAELARDVSYRLSTLAVEGGVPRESPRTWPRHALPGYLSYGTDFEASHGDWISWADSSWQWGMPGRAGPGKAYSGMRCWGTRLDENYAPQSRWRLTSPPLFLGKHPASRATMGLYHYYWTENMLDGGNLKISRDNGATWILVVPDYGYPSQVIQGLDGEPGFSGFSGGWVYSVFDLSGYLGDTITVMLDFGSDGSTEFPGWYVDDIVTVANAPVTGAAEDEPGGREALQGFSLKAVPNPTRGGVRVEYELAGPAEIELSVYNSLGRRVAVLARGREAAGNHLRAWDLRDGRGDNVPSGVYFCRLDAGVSLHTEKLIVAR